MIEALRAVDPWMLVAAILALLLLASIRFHSYDLRWTGDREQAARLRGYEMAVRQMRESELYRAEKEGHLP